MQARSLISSLSARNLRLLRSARSKTALENVQPFLIRPVSHRRPPPILIGRMDWTAVGQACGIQRELTASRRNSCVRDLTRLSAGSGPRAAEDIRSIQLRANWTTRVPRKSETAPRSRPGRILPNKTSASSSSAPQGNNRNRLVLSLRLCSRGPMIRPDFRMHLLIRSASSRGLLAALPRIIVKRFSRKPFRTLAPRQPDLLWLSALWIPKHYTVVNAGAALPAG